jgi:hypothetical protein
MARVLCDVCGGYVITGKANYVYDNGIHRHKACPVKRQPTSPEENKARRDLTDAIQHSAVKYGKPLNWKLIGQQIQSLKDKGYNYADQLYALKWLVEKDGEYWGYGRLEKFIAHAMEHKRKHEEFLANQQRVKELQELQEIDKEEFRKKIQNASRPEFLW